MSPPIDGEARVASQRSHRLRREAAEAANLLFHGEVRLEREQADLDGTPDHPQIPQIVG